MSSVVTHDHPTLTATGPVVHELLVLWQHPDTRQIIPIGRFSYDGGEYAFVYTRAALGVTDFRPLPGLDDLQERYVSHQLPSIFEQRVMASHRPDYRSYLRSLGRTTATPWEQIVESGGTRVGDTLQFMALPRVEDGRVRARFLASGVRHISSGLRGMPGGPVNVCAEDQMVVLDTLDTLSRLELIPENNREDSNALLIVAESVPVGWVPRSLSADVRRLMLDGPVNVDVLRVRPDAPPHLQLVLDLDSPAPQGFSFDPEGHWQPASDQ